MRRVGALRARRLSLPLPQALVWRRRHLPKSLVVLPQTLTRGLGQRLVWCGGLRLGLRLGLTLALALSS